MISEAICRKWQCGAVWGGENYVAEAVMVVALASAESLPRLAGGQEASGVGTDRCVDCKGTGTVYVSV